MQNSETHIPPSQKLSVAQLEKQIQRLEKLNQIIESVYSQQLEDMALQQIIEEGIGLLHANQGSIVLIGKDDQKEMKTLIREHDATTG